MKKWIRWTAILLLGTVLTGCSFVSREEERTPVDYTVAAQEEIPEELMTMIENQKEQPFQMQYGDQTYLYLTVGYGKQDAGGYSIQVEEVSESEQEIHVTTKLVGPETTEKISEGATYPYIVLKIEFRDKIVMFH